jgi:sterol desaturase/sphingolipid hydroxylase (fatty acid hydroxylase superfamily)
MILEFLLARHLFDVKESLSGFAIAAGASFVAFFTKVIAFGVFVFFFEFLKDFRIEYLGYESFGFAWYVWIFAIIADDLSFYWHHRLSHTIRLLWAAHVPHHSAKSFNFTIGIRNGWFVTLYKPIFWLWMAFLGFEPAMIATALIINGIYQFFLHTQLIPSLGWYEKIFNTPYIHQVHHSSNVEYLDKNHGGIFIIWDKIFGTFQDVDSKINPKYGILKDPNTYNPILLNTHEFSSIWKDVLRAPSWKDKFKYILYPPGWSHDNSSKTASELQQELAEKSVVN